MATQIAFAFANNVPWKRNYQMLRNGVPVVLVGASLYMQFRSSMDPRDDNVAMDLSTPNGRLPIIDGANGIWGFQVELIDATQVPAGTYYHDMLAFLATGEILRPYEGTAVVEQGITRGGIPWFPI